MNSLSYSVLGLQIQIPTNDIVLIYVFLLCTQERRLKRLEVYLPWSTVVEDNKNER